MGRRLSTGLILVRSCQLLGSLVPGVMNGWLLFYLNVNRLGAAGVVLVLEVLVAAIFTHSLAALLAMHVGRRPRGTSWMVTSVCFDVVFLFANVAVISLLSNAGLPSNCAGLTEPLATRATPAIPALSATSIEDLMDSLPLSSPWTTQFSDEKNGHIGALDKYCNMERGFFYCAIFLIFTYILAIIITVLRIRDLTHTPNSEVEQLLDSREELMKLELKLQEHELQPLAESPATSSIPSLHASGPGHAAAEQARPLSPLLPSSSRYVGIIPEAPLRHEHYAGSSSVAGLPTRSPGSPLLQSQDFNSDTSEIHANMAMISDGSRYTPGTCNGQMGRAPQLPPYSPGNQRTMNGHGLENNDTLLSKYVKEETRAQEMKDAGDFQ